MKRDAEMADIKLKYKISGPLPIDNSNFQTIYTATQEGNTDEDWVTPDPMPEGDPDTYYFTHAKGVAARTNPSNDGALDLQTNQTQIPGGVYLIESSIDVPDENVTANYAQQILYLAFNNDLQVNRIIAPRDKNRTKYPISGGQIPVEAKFTNIGINPITEFEASARIYDPNGNLVYEATDNWANASGIVTGESVTIEFPSYLPSTVGDFRVVVEADLLSAVDEALGNNILPISGETYYFNVAHEIELEAVDVLSPNGEIFVGRPIRTKGKFANHGVSDASEIPAKMTITQLSSGDIVYEDEIIIQDVPAGRFNISENWFGTNFIPPSAGEYQACIEVMSPDDPITGNNVYCENFDVIDAMNGTYTIGTLRAGQARNFLTLQDAADAMFKMGLTGPVTFELTDSYYKVGDKTDLSETPALDFRSKIIGVSSTNTITFKPSLARSMVRGGVHVEFSSYNGIGAMFGQASEPSNTFAAVLIVTPSLIPLYANSEGYLTFDGGDYQAIKFTMDTDGDFRAPFYLADGASNISIKNIIITNSDNNNRSNACSLPRYLFDDSFGFIYEDDNRAGETYSAGIVVRSKVPFDEKTSSNYYSMDTLSNKNNVISGNNISGFGYGIASMGTGILFVSGPAEYHMFYNQNNMFVNNTVHDVTGAGIFVGYEQNSTIKNNVIYDLHADCNGSVDGILAGAASTSDGYGYNNISLTIDGNEISQLNADNIMSGITVLQTQLEFYDAIRGRIVFPDGNDNTKVINNVIFGFDPQTAGANRQGIMLYTDRTDELDPVFGDYFTSNDLIANNTVIINSDAGLTNSGNVIGVGILNSANPTFKNNAIAILDESIDESNDVASTVLFVGDLPENDGISSERNAYYTGNSNAAIYRYVQIDDASNIIDYGSRDEFQNIDQWRQWTGSDIYSTVGNFMTDYEFVGSDVQSLRVVSDPIPIGSMLNNTGEIIDDVETDIFGTPRGSAGQRYDIGAIEFNGRQYISDVSVVTVHAPGAYKATLGEFNDAEYIMTTAPVEIKAMLHNTGNLGQNSAEVTVSVYLEDNDGNFSTVPEFVETVTADLPPTEFTEVMFNLADGMGTDFVPQTYYDLLNNGFYYAIPDKFTTMVPNVTPRYKIVVYTESDQNNANNIYTKIVRFYLDRSNLNMLISAESSYVDVNSTSATQDNIAGQLNYTALVNGLAELGWVNDRNADQFDFDVFERSGWEPRAVNYTIFRTILWSDGEEKGLVRYEVNDLIKFFDAFDGNVKRNLIVSSQEMVRQMQGSEWAEKYARAANAVPSSPLGMGVSYDGYNVIGSSIGRDLVYGIASTGFDNGTLTDNDPFPGLMTIVEDGDGQVTTAYFFETVDMNATSNIMGVANVSLSRNFAYLGIDWRHFDDLEKVLRSLVDFIENNEGIIIAVELLNFDAERVGSSIELNWATASEHNSSMFEIERATEDQTGRTAFVKIDEMEAAGTTTGKVNYGPVVDRDVQFGNTYVYRLKMIDVDGEWKYSDERTVEMSNEFGMLLNEVVPNPVKTTSKFSFTVNTSANVEFAIYDLQGRIVYEFVNGSVASGVHEYDLNAGDFASGTYTLILRSGDIVLTKQVNIVK